MNPLSFSRKLIVAYLLASAPLFAVAQISAHFTAAARIGGQGSGGGDMCEDRLKIIRADLRDWISRGGPNGLKLPQGWTADRYSVAMLKPLVDAKIKCVGQGDAGFPVVIGKTPKACRFDKAPGQVTCDYEKFLALDESDQYVLLHHEFAGLADVEKPKGADSDYSVSNQISGFLEETLVKKLAVKPGLPAGDEVVTFKAKVAVDTITQIMPQQGVDSLVLALTKGTELTSYTVVLEPNPQRKSLNGQQSIDLLMGGIDFRFTIEIEHTQTGYTYYTSFFEIKDGQIVGWADLSSVFNLPTPLAPTMHMQGDVTPWPAGTAGEGKFLLPNVFINGEQL